MCCLTCVYEGLHLNPPDDDDGEGAGAGVAPKENSPWRRSRSRTYKIHQKKGRRPQRLGHTRSVEMRN